MPKKLLKYDYASSPYFAVSVIIENSIQVVNVTNYSVEESKNIKQYSFILNRNEKDEVVEPMYVNKLNEMPLGKNKVKVSVCVGYPKKCFVSEITISKTQNGAIKTGKNFNNIKELMSSGETKSQAVEAIEEYFSKSKQRLKKQKI